MAPAPAHQCRIQASPWPEVYAVETASSRHYGRHSHGTYGFGVLDVGAHRSSSDRRIFDAYAGDILATNPGEMHDGRPLGVPWRRWHTVYLEPAVFAGMAPAAGDVRITQAAFADRELQGAVRCLLAALHGWQRRQVEALACEEALVQACGLLLQRHTTQRALEPDARVPLAPIRQRLADDLLKVPSLAELAGEAGISRFQLLRRFASAYGCTPYAFVVQQRAERARGLIRAGADLAAAAAASGFADQSHMTRLFTRQFGFTPGAWQRATRHAQ